MNDAVKTMSDLLAGDYCKTIIVGGKVFVMKAPTIKVIARTTRDFSLVDIPKEAEIKDMMKIASENSDNIVKGLSYLIVGDVDGYERKAAKVAEELRSGTHEELFSALIVAFNLITGKDFFQCASLAMELANLIVKPRS